MTCQDVGFFIITCQGFIGVRDLAFTGLSTVSERPPLSAFLSSIKVKHIVNIVNRQHTYLREERFLHSHL